MQWGTYACRQMRDSSLCLQVEMYADPVARGGVLEPEGIVEIKFRVPDLLKAMHRLDPVIRGLKEEAALDFEQAVKDRETALLPVYRQVRTRALCKLHLALQLIAVQATIWASAYHHSAKTGVCQYVSQHGKHASSLR